MAVRKGLTIYRIMVQEGAFLAMVRSALTPNTKWTLSHVINDWWATAFTTDMPRNKTVGEVIIAICYKLIMNGYDKEEITAPEKFLKNYYAAVNYEGAGMSELSGRLNKCDKYKDYYTITIDQLFKLFPINSTEEAGMAVKKSTKTNGGKKATAPKTGNFLDGCKSPRLRLYIPKILEQKMTDQEIVDFMHKENFKEVNKGFISSARRNLNERVYKWAPEIKTELQEVKEDKEPTRPASSKKDRAGEPSRPKAKTDKKLPDRKADEKKRQVAGRKGEPTRPDTKKKAAVKKTARKTAVKKTAKKTAVKKTATKKTATKRTATKKVNKKK